MLTQEGQIVETSVSTFARVMRRKVL